MSRKYTDSRDMYLNHTSCRSCGYGKSGAQGIKAAPGDKLIPVLDLGIHPLANDFCREGEERAGLAPLKLLLCPECGLGQLSVVVRPGVLYSRYLYVTSPSQTMQDHFHALVSDIASETDGRTVLEIGSNDGKLLAFMQNKGYSCVGVDPAENLASMARGRGIPTEVGFFNSQLADSLPKSEIVIARHVFCHVDDWRDFVKGLEMVSLSSSLVCIETPYAGDMLKNCEFDTVYHEHLSYLTIRSLEALLRGSLFHIHKVIRYPIHGGAILVMLRRNDSGIQPSETTQIREDGFSVENWRSFATKAQEQIDRLRTTIRTLAAEGKRVAGLGASAKSTVWITSCGLNRKDIAFIADNTPQKHWTVSPGTDIPITDEGAILRDLPDYVVMWAWNYREEILEKFSLARSKGVKFIIPVPELDIV